MAWQILMMWAIVVATIVWFTRTEKREKDEAALHKAAQYAAQSPRYRYQPSTPREPTASATPIARTGGLTETQRAFLKALVKTD